MKRQMVGWFEIPVTDMDRAIRFYQQVFDIKIDRHQLGPLDMGWFPFIDENAPGTGGSLVAHPEHYHPSTEGSLLYFSSHTGDLEDELGRVEDAGGKILQQKTPISEEHGYMALFLDSEGNRVALHSRG